MQRGTGQCPGPAARQALAFSGSLGLAVFYFLGFIQNYQVPNPAPWRRLGIGCEIFLQSLVAGADDQFRGHQTDLFAPLDDQPGRNHDQNSPDTILLDQYPQSSDRLQGFPQTHVIC